MVDHPNRPDADRTTASGGYLSMSWVKDVRWKLILLLGAIQVVPATLAIFNLYSQWVEFLIGAVLALTWVTVLWLRRVNRPFLSGVFIGITAGLVTAALQGTFVRVYLEYHPELLQSNPDATTLAWAASIAGVSLLGGVAVGLITGGLAWLVNRIWPMSATEALA